MIRKEEKEKALLFGSESRRRRRSNKKPLLPLQGQTTLTVALSPSLTINTVFSFSFPAFLSFSFFLSTKTNHPCQTSCINSTHLFFITVSCFGIHIMEFKVAYYHFSWLPCVQNNTFIPLKPHLLEFHSSKWNLMGAVLGFLPWIVLDKRII